VKYPLQLLLKIRRNREEAASSKLQREITEEERCRYSHERCLLELDSYRSWCVEESDRIMGRLAGAVVPKTAIDQARSQIQWNTEGEEPYRKRVEVAAEELRTSILSREKAEEERRLAGLAMERIATHRQEWINEQKRREEEAEDAELQEIAEIMFNTKMLAQQS